VSSLSGTGDPQAVELEREALDTRLRTLVPSDVDWRSVSVPPGADATGSVIEYVEDLSPVLLVVGTRSRSSVGKLLLGRAQQRVLLEVTVPILVVKPPQDES